MSDFSWIDFDRLEDVGELIESVLTAEGSVRCGKTRGQVLTGYRRPADERMIACTAFIRGGYESGERYKRY